MAQRAAGARRRAMAKKKTRKTTRIKTARKSVSRAVGRLARLQEDLLPPTLAQFSKHMQTRLRRLERRLGRAEESRYLRRWVGLLREASHQLGHLEAAGEKRFRRLTTQARRDARKLLRRLDKALEPSPRTRTARSRSRARR